MIDQIFSSKKGVKLLWVVGFLLLFCMLGARELWTMESRWADIVMNFFYRNDFLHPYLHGKPYYDKPLLSYWMMAFFSFFTNGVGVWALRLPSAIAGAASVWAIYRLGKHLYGRRQGKLAAWMLLSTYYFIFYARISSADMLTLCGVLLAVCWYAEHRTSVRFRDYMVFFMLASVTSLCKGLLGFVLPLLIILPDQLHENRWKQHCRPSFFLAILPAVAVYLLPFWLSSHFNSEGYGQNGFWQVFRENVMRFYNPFDHKGGVQTYFIYFPLYLLPWTFFFVPAMLSTLSRPREAPWEVRWMYWATLLIFCFFTLSQSRRSYYILPILPYAILATTSWINAKDTRVRYAAWCAGIFIALFVLIFDVFVPVYYSDGGDRVFAQTLRAQASASHPWADWQVSQFDASKKVSFYLQATSEPEYHRHGEPASLLALPPLSIVVTQERNASAFAALLPDYQLIKARPVFGDRLLHQEDRELSVAFIR